jgi:Lar family restriction alleviation protein
MRELKPCPFCGGEAAYTQILGNYGRPHEVYCSTCDGGITEGRSKDGVIHNWNNRPIEDALTARIAELEAEQRWIPVSERLPEFNKVVAVIDMSDKDSHLCNVYETAILVEVRGDTRFGFIGHSGWDSSDVTHWMPLPKLPEVQE